MNKNFYTLKDSSIAYFLCLAFMFGASLVLSLLIGIVSGITGAEMLEVQGYNSILYVNMFLSTIIFLLIFITINATSKTSFLVASRLKTKFNYYLALAVVGLAVVVFLGGLNITNLYNHALTNIFPAQTASAIKFNNFGIFLVQVLLLGLLPAVFEELVFRGIIYNGLRQKFGAVASIIISAVLFMLMHLSIYKSFYQIVLGVVLALLVYYTGSIIYGMIFHFTNNFIILLLLYISPNGSVFELVKMGELPTAVWGTKEVLLAILFFIIGVALTILIFYFIKKYTFKHKNYFNLESSKNPLNNVTENNANILNPTSPIETTNKSNSASLWFWLSIVGFVVLWIMNSCGVSI